MTNGRSTGESTGTRESNPRGGRPVDASAHNGNDASAGFPQGARKGEKQRSTASLAGLPGGGGGTSQTKVLRLRRRHPALTPAGPSIFDFYAAEPVKYLNWRGLAHENIPQLLALKPHRAAHLSSAVSAGHFLRPRQGSFSSRGLFLAYLKASTLQPRDNVGLAR